jgi:hypothetical protein
MRCIGRCALMATALVSWMSAQGAPGPSRPTIESALASAEAAYASIDAFTATGWVESEMVEADGRTQPDVFGRREFDVFFVRPDTLMLMMVHPGSEEFRTPWAWMLNLQGGQATYTTSTNPPTLKSATLEEGVGAAAALGSHGLNLIAGLLLPEAVSRCRLRDMLEPALVGEESVRDVECWKVKGKFRGLRHAVTVWIAKATGLVCQSTLDRTDGEALRRATIVFESVRVRTTGESTMRSVIGGSSR